MERLGRQGVAFIPDEQFIICIPTAAKRKPDFHCTEEVLKKCEKLEMNYVSDVIYTENKTAEVLQIQCQHCPHYKKPSSFA